jgi:hypothetical protein
MENAPAMTGLLLRLDLGCEASPAGKTYAWGVSRVRPFVARFQPVDGHVAQLGVKNPSFYSLFLG